MVISILQKALNNRRPWVNFLVLFFLFWPLYDMLTIGEHYPFSSYRMYCHRFSFENLFDADHALYGVYGDGSEHLAVDDIAGVNETALRGQFVQIIFDRPPHEAPGLINSSMNDILEQCTKNLSCEASAINDYGRLKGLRLYNVRYTSLGELRDKNPSVRKLITEAFVHND